MDWKLSPSAPVYALLILVGGAGGMALLAYGALIVFGTAIGAVVWN